MDRRRKVARECRFLEIRQTRPSESRLAKVINTTKAFSGETESCPYRHGDGASSDSRVNSASTSTSRKVGASTESGSGGFGFRLGRACE